MRLDDTDDYLGWYCHRRRFLSPVVVAGGGGEEVFFYFVGLSSLRRIRLEALPYF